MAIISQREDTQPDSASDIEKYTGNLLRAAGVGDKLPTPQNDIIECAELVLEGGIDLDDYGKSLFNKSKEALFSGLKKILGVLDVREKVIIISPDVSDPQKPFITYHEVTHNILPWQVDTYKYFADNNEILRQDIKNQYEKEANFGSTKLLFQGDRFRKEAMDYEFSLRTAIKFKEDYCSSFHSTFWHYVSTNSTCCALLVMRKSDLAEIRSNSMEYPYNLFYPITSKSFRNEFGGVEIPDRYYSNHPFIAPMNNPLYSSSDVYEGEVYLLNRNGERVDLKFEGWSNSYNLFVLVWKKDFSLIRKKKVVFEPGWKKIR